MACCVRPLRCVTRFSATLVNLIQCRRVRVPTVAPADAYAAQPAHRWPQRFNDKPLRQRRPSSSAAPRLSMHDSHQRPECTWFDLHFGTSGARAVPTRAPETALAAPVASSVRGTLHNYGCRVSEPCTIPVVLRLPPLPATYSVDWRGPRTNPWRDPALCSKDMAPGSRLQLQLEAHTAILCSAGSAVVLATPGQCVRSAHQDGACNSRCFVRQRHLQVSPLRRVAVWLGPPYHTQPGLRTHP